MDRMDTLANYRARAPFVSILFALIIGITIAMLVPVSQERYTLVQFCLFTFLGLFVVLLFLGIKYKKAILFGITGCSFFFITSCWGWIITWKHHPAIDTQHFSHAKASILLGYIADDPLIKENSLRVEFVVTALKEKEGGYRRASGKLLLDIRDEQLDTSLAYGDELLLRNKCQRINPPYNPHEFDYAQYMSNHNCWHRSYHTRDNYIKTGNKSGFWWIDWALSIRKKMIDKFEGYFKNEEALAMMSTLVLGYRATLDKELVKAFSSTGTIHVLAVSGMHVAIVFAFLSFGLRWLGRRSILRFIRLLVLLLSVWMYTFLTGFSASVLRAALMISFFIIGNNFLKDRNTLNHMAASAFFLLLFDPKYLVDVGFQLSYLAVIGIVWLSPMLIQAFNLSNTMLRKGLQAVALSCGAQLTTTPLVLYYFHLFPVYFLPANLFISFPATLMIYVGFLLLALPVNQVSLWIAGALEKMIMLVDSGLLAIESWPMATIGGVWLAIWEYLFLYFLLLLTIITFHRYRKVFLYALLICLLGGGIWWNVRTLQRHMRRQLVVFNLHNQVAIALLNGNQPILYSDAISVQDLSLQYAVLPTMEALSGRKNIRFIPMPSRADSERVAIKDKLIRFMGRWLWIMDGREEVLLPEIVPDWVLIRNNPEIISSAWMKKLTPHTLLILDSSNKLETIAEISRQANDLGILVYCLKDNFAYVSSIK